ncbi:MAG: DUF7573 domain-containing protein [Halobacteriota archaeon]
MEDNRSLDEFLGGGNAGAEADDDATDRDARNAVDGNAAKAQDCSESSNVAVDEPTDTDAVDPAVSTYRWSPDGVACAECGEQVTKRWHDDGRYVCANCKEW